MIDDRHDWESKLSDAACARLRRGRGRLRNRAMTTAAARGALGAVTVIAIASVASRALGIEFDATATGVAGTVTVALGAAVTALRAKVRVDRVWPIWWDHATGLPQTVESTIAIAVNPNRSEWASALLERAASLPLPPPSGVVRLLPWRVGPASGVALVALVLLLATSIPASPIAPTPSAPDRAGTITPAAETRLEAVRDLVTPYVDLDENARRLLDELDPRRTELTPEHLDDAIAAAEAWLEGARARGRARREAARELRAIDSTSPLAEWLTTGELESIPETESRAARDALERGARALDASDRAVAEWLRRPDARTAPTLELGEWRVAAAALERLRDAAHVATHRDTNAATGGRDRSGEPTTDRERRDSPNNSDDTSPESDRNVDTISGTRTGRGERLPAEVFEYDTRTGDPEWERVLTHPAIEPAWLEALERYRRATRDEAAPQKEARSEREER